MSKNKAKAAQAIAESALKKAGAKKVKGAWNMTPAVRKLARARSESSSSS